MPGRSALVAMIPVNLVLIAWVWMGRVFFGVGGWFVLIFMFTLVPILLMLLAVTTLLAFTQPGRPRSLTTWQTWSQAVLWAGLFAFGAFTPDFGDTEESYTSLLTQVFGRSDVVLDLSHGLALFAGAVAFGGWVSLLLALLIGRRPAGPPAPPGAPGRPGPPVTAAR